MSDLRARLADALRENIIHYLTSPMIDFEGIADVLLSLPGVAVVELPSVAHKGPHDTDASLFRGAADRLDGGYSPGGSNVKRAISQLLRAAADAADQAAK